VSALSPANELVGAVLNGRWRLMRLLGEGGMGAVYEAEGAPGVGKRAIKLLHQEYVQEEQILSRFFAEAEATRTLNHPNVAQVLETATAENGTPYLVMELLQGVPVASYVDQGQALPQAQAVHLVHGVLQALSAAHARGIVHRDIKPDNLFLVHDANGSFHTKVLDFGIAKVMDVAGGMGQKTRTGVLLGTPGYMSPEQIRDSKGVDARTDLWSVGIIFYELLTGVSPFPAANEFARLTSVLTEEVKPIEEVAPQLALWSGFIHRALAKDPARRFQSADEMAGTLLATARGPVAPNPRPSTWPAAQSALVSASAVTTAMEVKERPSAVSHAPLAFMTTAPVQPPVQSVRQVAPPQHPSGQMQAYSGYPVAAVSQGSVPPPPPRSGTIASTPPPALVSHVGPQGIGAAPTHLSAQQGAGAPMMHARQPSIDVIEPAFRPRSAPYWVVGVVAFVAFGLGLAAGLLIGMTG
jgi:eukaryotic-like serine/threonine-protein kinase